MRNTAAGPWTPRSREDAIRRAAGRRNYNSVRQARAEERRHELVRFWTAHPHPWTHGWQAQAARHLGVHRSTITRDMQALHRRVQTAEQCPLCGH